MFSEQNEPQIFVQGNESLPFKSPEQGNAYGLELSQQLSLVGLSYSNEMPGYGEHTVREGDTAWDIAGWFTDSPLNYRNIVEIDGSTLTDWETRHLEIGSKLYIKLSDLRQSRRLTSVSPSKGR